jgi:hypothetical protein
MFPTVCELPACITPHISVYPVIRKCSVTTYHNLYSVIWKPPSHFAYHSMYSAVCKLWVTLHITVCILLPVNPVTVHISACKPSSTSHISLYPALCKLPLCTWVCILLSSSSQSLNITIWILLYAYCQPLRSAFSHSAYLEFYPAVCILLRHSACFLVSAFLYSAYHNLHPAVFKLPVSLHIKICILMLIVRSPRNFAQHKCIHWQFAYHTS